MQKIIYFSLISEFYFLHLMAKMCMDKAQTDSISINKVTQRMKCIQLFVSIHLRKMGAQRVFFIKLAMRVNISSKNFVCKHNKIITLKLDCLFNSLIFGNKETKWYSFIPLEMQSTSERYISTNTESVSMSWRHREFSYPALTTRKPLLTPTWGRNICVCIALQLQFPTSIR